MSPFQKGKRCALHVLQLRNIDERELARVVADAAQLQHHKIQRTSQNFRDNVLPLKLVEREQSHAMAWSRPASSTLIMDKLKQKAKTYFKKRIRNDLSLICT